MSLDLIKSYLVGLGFEIDKSSLNEAVHGMDNIEKKVRDFNDNSNKGFSETSNSLKDLFSLLASSNTIGGLFPGLRKPLNNILADIKNIKKSYDSLSDSKKDIHRSVPEETIEKKSSRETIKNEVNEKIKNVSKEFVKKKEIVTNKIKETVKDITTNRIENKIVETEVVKPKKLIKGNAKNIKKVTPNIKDVKGASKGIKAIGSASADTTAKIGGLKKGISSLVSKGGGAFKALAVGSVASLVAIVAAIVAVLAAIAALIVGIKKLTSYLKKLAEEDIGYEKLSRTLWTTKQTAKEVSQALDILGASMEDLWLSPTLLKQFNQLRKDASQIRIPPEFQENLKIVQGIGLEFKRLKQLIGLLFEWIGHYILDYLKGPLADVKESMGDFNGWLIENIPRIAEGIGKTIGMFLKFLFVLGKVLAILFKLISPIVKIIQFFMKIGKHIDNLPDKTKRAAKGIIIALALILNPLLLAIALLEDFFVFMRGGKSVIGDVVDFFSRKWEEAIDGLLDKFPLLKKLVNFVSGTSSGWKEYKEEAEESASVIGFAFGKLRDKFKKGLSPNKEKWSNDVGIIKKDIGDIDELVANANISKQGFSLPDIDFKSYVNKASELFGSLKDKWSDFKSNFNKEKLSKDIDIGITDINLDEGKFTKFGENVSNIIDKIKDNIKSLKVKSKERLGLNKDEWIGYRNIAIETIGSLLERFKSLRNEFKEEDLLDSTEWDSYYNNAKDNLDKLKDKAKNVLSGVKDLSNNMFDKGKGFIKNGAENIVRFEKEHGNGTGPSVAKSYATTNNSSIRTTNNSNEVINKNNINVYGNDANATGGVISKRLTGITSRNLQGAIE